MIGKALYAFALIATLQFSLADYCFGLPKNNFIISQKPAESIPCFIAGFKPPDDPPSINFPPLNIPATFVTASGTASTSTVDITKEMSYVIKK